jgi:Flp pilus assembly secretin CpaC
VNERLSDDHYLDASNIEVQVQSGTVTLSGEVEDRESKRRAEDIVESCSGVQQVQNNIRVQSSSSSWFGNGSDEQEDQSGGASTAPSGSSSSKKAGSSGT